MEIELGKNQEKIKQLKEKEQQIQQQINQIVIIILDSQNIDYQNKKIKFSDDLTKIIIED